MSTWFSTAVGSGRGGSYRTQSSYQKFCSGWDEFQGQGVGNSEQPTDGRIGHSRKQRICTCGSAIERRWAPIWSWGAGTLTQYYANVYQNGGEEDVQLQQQQTDCMKKTHTKNMLSMAPSLQMFTKQSIHKQQKTPPTTIYQVESLATASKHPSLKYNRSISSSDQVRKNYRDSPDKKHSAFANQSSTHIKSRPTLPKGAIDLTPFDKIASIFTSDINSASEETLYEDFITKFATSITILETSLQSESLLIVFNNIRQYFKRIITMLLRLAEKQLAHCNQQILTVCSEYQAKLKQTEKKQKERISAEFTKANSEIGKKVREIYHRSLFNTQIFNQMEYENIDMIGWIRESEAMDMLLLSMDQPKSSAHSHLSKSISDASGIKGRHAEQSNRNAIAEEGGYSGHENKKKQEDWKKSMAVSNKKQYTQIRRQSFQFLEEQLELVERPAEKTVGVRTRQKNRREEDIEKANRSN